MSHATAAAYYMYVHIMSQIQDKYQHSRLSHPVKQQLSQLQFSVESIRGEASSTEGLSCIFFNLVIAAGVMSHDWLGQSCKYRHITARLKHRE